MIKGKGVNVEVYKVVCLNKQFTVMVPLSMKLDSILRQTVLKDAVDKEHKKGCDKSCRVLSITKTGAQG